MDGVNFLSMKCPRPASLIEMPPFAQVCTGSMKAPRLQANATTAPLSAAALTRYAQTLHRYLTKRVRSREDVADLTQEIFELFLRRKDQSETVRNPLAYLFRIAFHVVGDSLADAQRNPVTFDSTLAGDPGPSEAQSSDEDAEQLAVQEDVLAALNRLPAQYLTALMLVEGQGMSYKEAAKASGFTPSTIATYVMHGRAALKLALDGQRLARKSQDSQR